MPSHPPDIPFYENAQNYTLWRDVSRLFEEFCGEKSIEWTERENRFRAVLRDIEERFVENRY